MSNHDFKGPKIAFQATPGSTRGHFGGRLGLTLGGSWGDFGGSEGGQGGSEEGQGRPPAADFFFHFRRFKIMKLCQNLNLLWKRLEID